MKRIAINGLGRIGKLVFQYLLESEGYGRDYEVVAINDLTNVYDLSMLLKYDSTQLSFTEKGHTIDFIDLTGETDENRKRYESIQGFLVVDGVDYPVFAEKDPAKLPWGEFNVDVVCECTGRFATITDSFKHIVAGAKHVIVNSPVKGVKNIVYNVNSDTLDGSEDIICGASCTTNCLAPLCKILDKEFGIVKGMMTTVHSYTADQSILDCPHKKGANSRRGRCAGANIVPASTGAAEAVAKALPQLKGKLTGMAMRVPTPTGSVVVFDVELNGEHFAEDINKVIMENMDNESISGTFDPVVSSDIVGIPYGSYVDFLSTKVLECSEGTTMAQIVSWYDNESSYTHQFVKTLIAWMSLIN
ncbi:MAG: type I glyceraldehyde-3-phosphate dehydrogenase [Bacillota bacterium]|nr:type I glyceraldehyde-3-phosphate dehydrogenase [Bacillota bacterium]